jgi:hypothetical protein
MALEAVSGGAAIGHTRQRGGPRQTNGHGRQNKRE